MEETNALKLKSSSEDSFPQSPVNAEFVTIEEDHYAALQADLESDARDIEAESWSLAVEQQYPKTLHKDAIKRQDVIYELIQTEVHHVRTLKILLRVYQQELRESLQMEQQRLEKLFPQVEELLLIHQHFLDCLKGRRVEAMEPGSDRNYYIERLGDVLIAQFSGEMGDRMKESYGVFCSHHSEAVNLYKEQVQNNKKFQNLVKKIGQLAIVRRLGVPECILLITQRITKYPVLVERILQNTEGGTQEHEELERSLALIKDAVMQVDMYVNQYEKDLRLRDVLIRLEPKSQGKMRKLIEYRQQRLLHQSTLGLKAASGRHKDVLVLVLSDIVLLLQEKDQKLAFSTVDNKPSMINLHKLIVREVAHDEKAMFLIVTSSNMPEMYEFQTSSKEDCIRWMELLRQAVESFSPHTEEEEPHCKVDEAQAAMLRNIQECLNLKDAEIEQRLREKLQMFAQITGAVPEVENGSSHCNLLLRTDASGEQLIKRAITAVENLQNLMLSDVSGQNEGDSVLRVRTPSIGEASLPDQKPCASPVLPLTETEERMSWSPACYSSFPGVELSFQFKERMLQLLETLYSLEAIICRQDSMMELMRASLERERTGRGYRGNGLLEQEKQRNLEKQREEMVRFQKQQNQLRLEQAQWERQRERQELESQAEEASLLLRQEECRRQEARVHEERQELELQRQTYQEDLERLREATRTVEKEKERLEQQTRLKQHKSFTKAATGIFEPSQPLPPPPVLNGEEPRSSASDELLLSPKSQIRPSASLSPGNVPPEVPPRRESMSVQSVKAEVPLHLVGTVNQAHKQAAVPQKIPTKLAVLGKGKEKRGKGSHQRTKSAAASIDMTQVLPIRVSGKEGGSLRSTKSVSQPVRPPDLFRPLETAVKKPTSSASTRKTPNQGPAQQQPPHVKVTPAGPKEDIIFF